MRSLVLLTATLALLATSGIAQNDPLARARTIHKQVPLIDGHNDYPWALRDLDPGRDFAKADITGSVPALMTDIPRLRQGGVGGQFWSVYVPSTMQGKEAVRATLEQIDIVHRMMRRWPETFETGANGGRHRAHLQERAHRLDDRHGGRALDRQLARHAADDACARRRVHDPDPQRQRAVGRLGDRQAGTRRPFALWRGGSARDELARHARRSLDTSRPTPCRTRFA